MDIPEDEKGTVVFTTKIFKCEFPVLFKSAATSQNPGTFALVSNPQLDAFINETNRLRDLRNSVAERICNLGETLKEPEEGMLLAELMKLLETVDGMMSEMMDIMLGLDKGEYRTE
ncbi:MAG: hypothetical protein Q9213_005651 [Squamulea squamosa]